MNRRKFIAQSIVGSAALTGLLKLSSCKSIEVFSIAESNKKLEVPLSKFAEINALRVRVSSLPYDILLVKKGPEIFKAYYMKCTHNDASVQFDGKSFQCPLHGSSFDDNGKVLIGPAAADLKSFEVQKTESVLTILLNGN